MHEPLPDFLEHLVNEFGHVRLDVLIAHDRVLENDNSEPRHAPSVAEYPVGARRRLPRNFPGRPALIGLRKETQCSLHLVVRHSLHTGTRIESNLRQPFRRVSKLLNLNAHVVHHAEEQAAHLAVFVVGVVQVLATLNSSAGPANHHDR